MIDWRERAWFRLMTFLVVAMLAGGFARIMLGYALDAAEANRGAAVFAGAVLFGLGVRHAVRLMTRERRPGLRALDDPQEEEAGVFDDDATR